MLSSKWYWKWNYEQNYWFISQNVFCCFKLFVVSNVKPLSITHIFIKAHSMFVKMKAIKPILTLSIPLFSPRDPRRKFIISGNAPILSGETPGRLLSRATGCINRYAISWKLTFWVLNQKCALVISIIHPWKYSYVLTSPICSVLASKLSLT